MITVVKKVACIALLLSVSGYSRADAQQTSARNRIAALKLTNFAEQSIPAPADVTSKVNAFIQPLIEGEVVSGLVIGLIDGDKTYILGYGSVSPSQPGKPDGNTLYEIGSITKVFTGTLLADMVGRKEAQLNAPIAKYLPSTAKTPAFEGTPITLLDLATQSSGLPRLPDISRRKTRLTRTPIIPATNCWRSFPVTNSRANPARSTSTAISAWDCSATRLQITCKSRMKHW